MNTPVNVELNKLLKEIKFEETTGRYFYPAPNIGDVVMWLYEKHGIWIVILPELLNGTEIRYYPSVFEQGIGEDVESYFNSPTEAYEAAIEYTLKELI